MTELENIEHVNEPIIYRLAQIIYDFLDDKIVPLNDEKQEGSLLILIQINNKLFYRQFKYY
jgi:hypothetical protein